MPGQNFRDFYENGVLHSEGEMYKGYKVGHWKSYDANGVLISEGDYLDKENFPAEPQFSSFLTGTWKYYDFDEKLVMIFYNVDESGTSDKWTIYYPNGKIKEKCDGIVSTTFDENGKELGRHPAMGQNLYLNDEIYMGCKREEQVEQVRGPDDP